jgi:hypothetical protein
MLSRNIATDEFVHELHHPEKVHREDKMSNGTHLHPWQPMTFPYKKNRTEAINKD